MSTERVHHLTPDELKTLVREAVREELEDAGLRLSEPEHREEAREDFRFIRRFRKGMESTANKIGMAIILAVTSGLVAATWAGFRSFVKP